MASYLDTFSVPIIGTPTSFVVTVPGHQQWAIRSVYAVASRAAGGAPDRAYLLTVATSTGPVSVTPATDAGSEPGECTITWANAPAADVAAGASGFVIAPFAPPPLAPGYTITGEITNPALGDAWTLATVWYDFTYTA